MNPAAANETFNLNGRQNQRARHRPYPRTAPDKKANITFVEDRAGNFKGRFISSARRRHARLGGGARIRTRWSAVNWYLKNEQGGADVLYELPLITDTTPIREGSGPRARSFRRRSSSTPAAAPGRHLHRRHAPPADSGQRVRPGRRVPVEVHRQPGQRDLGDRSDRGGAGGARLSGAQCVPVVSATGDVADITPSTTCRRRWVDHRRRAGDPEDPGRRPATWAAC
jgi:hypothetical protein